jgi:RNA polymerase sigma factor (sigma-70 family)
MEVLQKSGEPTTLDKVDDVLDQPLEVIEQVLVSGQIIRSLDAPFDSGEDRCLLDCVWDEDQRSVEDEILDFTMQEDVDAALAGLSSRESRVLRLYFGIGEDTALTLDQIGQQFGLTRERVRQIKEIALSKLRHPRLHGRLRPYADNLPERDLGAPPGGARGPNRKAFRPESLRTERTSPFLFKGWKGSADTWYRPPRRKLSNAVDPMRTRVSKNSVMMRLGAFLFVTTGLFFGDLLAALAGVSG